MVKRTIYEQISILLFYVDDCLSYFGSQVTSFPSVNKQTFSNVKAKSPSFSMINFVSVPMKLYLDTYHFNNKNCTYMFILSCSNIIYVHIIQI